MSENFLNTAQVGSPLQQMRRIAMPYLMRRQRLLDTELHPLILHQKLHITFRQPTTVRIDKKENGFIFYKLRTNRIQILPQYG